MDEVLILFSDHYWLYCYEDQIEHFYKEHNWKIAEPFRTVLIIKNWEKTLYCPNDDKNLK